MSPGSTTTGPDNHEGAQRENACDQRPSAAECPLSLGTGV